MTVLWQAGAHWKTEATCWPLEAHTYSEFRARIIMCSLSIFPKLWSREALLSLVNFCSYKDKLVLSHAQRLSAKHTHTHADRCTAINLWAHSCEMVGVACFNSGVCGYSSHTHTCTHRVTNSETDTLCGCIKQWDPPPLTPRHTSYSPPLFCPHPVYPPLS